MKALKSASKWLTAAAIAVAGIGLGGGTHFAVDPAFAQFNVSNLTIGGDFRVRGEGRWGVAFGGVGTSSNHMFAIQRTRLNVGYKISPDINFFVQLQDSRAWGAGPNNTGVPTGNLGFTSSQGDINGESFGLREGYIVVKNAGVANLNLKIGRQKLVFGDQRILGHFDWSNIGWSFDGARADYTSGVGSHVFGFFRQAEDDCVSDTSLCGGASTTGSADSDFLLWYNTLKMVPNMTIEPYLIYVFDGRPATASTTKTGRLAPDQKRLMLATRVNGKAMNNAIDYTGEVVWQTGQQKDGTAGTGSIRQTINAHAEAVKVGYTLKNMQMKPRVGVEFNYASGSGAGDAGGRHTFENFWPTNHLHMGYQDLMGWKNMVAISPQFKINPIKNGSLKLHFWWFWLAQDGDNWYGAGQGATGGGSKVSNSETEIGQEIDVIYTHKLKGGKLALQVGYGHFFTGSYINKSNGGLGPDGATGLTDSDDQDWGYIQLVTKF